MSQKATRIMWTGAAAALLALTIVVPRVSTSHADAREIRLVARGMTYYLEGQDEPNPTLRVSRGERVRVRLLNRDPGMSHDFRVGTWNVGTASTADAGEAVVVEFIVPSTPGEVRYACTPHGEMMRGTIRVE
jgi:plastocyanin